MKVKIVDKKEDVKEMTIEELLREDYIGCLSNATGKKFMYLFPASREHGFRRPPNYIFEHSFSSMEGCLRNANDRGQLHVFDEAKKLYLWMAE